MRPVLWLIYSLFFFLLPTQVFATISLKLSDLTLKDDYYEVTAVVSGMSSSSATFIQGMFTKVDSSKYFGFTFSKKGEWLSYDGSPEKSFVLDNYIELKNDSPQKVFIKPNYDDKNYSGPGKYLLKVKRYTSSGSPSDYADNNLEVDLNHSTPASEPTSVSTSSLRVSAATEPKQSTPTVTPTLTSTKTPTSKITTPILTKTPSPTDIKDLKTDISPSPQVLSTESSVIASNSETLPAGRQESPTPEIIASPSSPILSDKNLFLLGISVFALSGGLLYFRLKNL